MLTYWIVEPYIRASVALIVPHKITSHADFLSLCPVAVIRVYDAAGNVIETHEHKGDFKKW